MNDVPSDRTENGNITLAYDLDAPPEKVWRAAAIPAFRERWLPQADLAEPEPVASVPGEEVRYRMRDDRAPFLESTVIFKIEPGLRGGTLLRIIHRVDGQARRMSANDNWRPSSLAA